MGSDGPPADHTDDHGGRGDAGDRDRDDAVLAMLNAMPEPEPEPRREPQPEPQLRPRDPEDLPACAVALYGVHLKDGYPVRWPADPEHWLTPDHMLGAWVATDGPAVVGHVSLAQPGDAFAESIGYRSSQLALVGRLFVVPDARRGGLASALLSRAAQAARDAGRQAVLEVDANAPAAVAFYERAGWHHLRDATGGWIAADGLPARVRIYLAPGE